MKNILYFTRAIFNATILLLNMIFFACSILLIFCLIHLLPKKNWRRKGQAWLQYWPVWWMDINALILKVTNPVQWKVHGEANLTPQHWYLLICNHQSWIDILILGIFFRHKIPILKFFMKKELLWSLPAAGLACYALGYPFMARHSHEEIRRRPELKDIDLRTTRLACNKFKEFPTTVVNFVEGTRFTPTKKVTQHSPYQHLLKPKATGVALVLQELHDQLDGIVNVTLQYKPLNFTLFQFLQGKVEEIHLQFELLPITQELIGDPYLDREFRKSFQAWLNQLWNEKDQRLKAMLKQP